jgi:ABC-type Zn2+ transport system substrate-binding protein/surface adhesin
LAQLLGREPERRHDQHRCRGDQQPQAQRPREEYPVIAGGHLERRPERPLERGAEEPTPRSLAAIIDAARGARALVVVVEPQVDPHTALSLAEEIGARVARCDPLGDPRDPARASTLALRRWNAGALAAAFGGGAR